MDYILYITRFLYHIRWWLIIGTTIITLAVIYLTRNMRGNYYLESTLYTGVVSGYSIEASGKMDWAAAQNAMDNLINIIQAESTLKRVSMRLFARIMISGDATKDQNNITSASFRYTYDHVKNSPHGKELLALIDKSSEDRTIENLRRYEKPNKDNYIYGLFYFNHPYYSYGALKNIKVERKASSDLLKISYSSNDPGIAYNTMSNLMEEFVNEYRAIRYGETDKVIEYFRSELTRIGNDLRLYEDELTKYNVDKRIINYYDETKEIAAINKEFELREQDVLFAYNSSKAMLEELEKRMDNNVKQVLNSLQLIDKLNEASKLTGKITEMETISSSDANSGEKLQGYRNKLTQTRKELSDISDQYIGNKYSKEGLSKNSIVEQWLDQTLLYEKAKAELQIVTRSRNNLNERYAFFAPVGTTIKRKERVINFTEQNYLTVLHSYNEALMRKKNLEMTSATLKVLNPPAFPISAQSTNKKKIVMMACAGSFFAILAFMLLLEFIDRTLRDTMRTQRLTGAKVLGAFPAQSKKSHSSNKICDEIAIKYMSSSILRFLTERKENEPYIINFISTAQSSGKTYMINKLEEYWIKLGLKVRVLTAGVDFETNSRQFTLAKSISDLFTAAGEDILLIEYPDLRDSNIPSELLQEANLNLLISSAKLGWKDTDKVLLEKLKKQVGKAPYYVYLNHAERSVVEQYTGMLPPYTFLRKQLYRLSQLALTEKQPKSADKQKANEDDDD